MLSGTEKSASGEPASGFEKMPQEMEGLRKQVNQAAEKLEETADLDRMLQLLQSWALFYMRFGTEKRNCLNYRNREKDKGVFTEKRKNSRRNVRLLQLQKMRHFVFIMRITCGFWKRMVENSSGFRRLDRKNSRGSGCASSGRRLSGAVCPAAFRKCLHAQFHPGGN